MAPALGFNPVLPAIETAHAQAAPDGLAAIDPDFRQEMIATTAYDMGEQRGFTPGHELDDWLAAEARVDTTLQMIPAATGEDRQSS